MHYIAIGVLVVLLLIWSVMALLAWGKFNPWPHDPAQEQATEREDRE